MTYSNRGYPISQQEILCLKKKVRYAFVNECVANISMLRAVRVVVADLCRGNAR